MTEKIVNQIKELIRDKKLKPRDRLPSERELSEMLSVSRIAVREAIKVLWAMNLVDVRPGQGSFIKAVNAEDLADVLGLMVLDEATSENLVEVRRILEVAIAGLAAERRTDQDLAALKENIERMAEVGRQGLSYVDEDVRFHELLVRATKNALLERLMYPIAGLLYESRCRTASVPGSFVNADKGHREILEAVRRRDKRAAEQAMERHLEMVAADLARFAGWSSGEGAGDGAESAQGHR